VLFNSPEFFVFLSVVYILYWLVLYKNLMVQNALLLCASYTFYGWWDWRFLSLIAFSSLIDFLVGYQLGKTNRASSRRLLLFVTLSTNLGLLAVFKYFNFFIESFETLLVSIGLPSNTGTLDLILPVGISFYTFQTLSYTIDIYRGTLKPSRDWVGFFAFVSFFPQLVAGPIERASNLLCQFEKPRSFDFHLAKDGLAQILWGLFKKVVIADTCGRNADVIFQGYAELDGSMLLLGAIFFSFQIYGDFSGYSDIAIGTAKLFNIKLSRNFSLPYFSRSMGEFWARWHISLSSWFRDYLYIPLGGSYHGRLRQSANVLITFTVSGLWHGANWTFVFWGLLNGLLYLPGSFRKASNRSRVPAGDVHSSPISNVIRAGVTFGLVSICWIFFRSDTITAAFGYIFRMITENPFSVPTGYKSDLLLILVLPLIEWFQRFKEHGLQMDEKPVYFRWAVYYTFVVVILKNYSDQRVFIYFQF
jgi:alginate O-acetyltransferase complex protein AlgI